MKRFVEQLPCRLRESEKLLKSEELAEQLRQREIVEAEKKEANDAFKARLSEADRQVQRLAHEIRTGEEYRAVQCTEIGRWSENVVDIVRSDTGEVVRSRPMAAGERQALLELGDEPANDNGGSGKH